VIPTQPHTPIKEHLMRQFLRSLANGFKKARRRRPAPPTRHTNLRLEALEGRRQPSATAYLSDGYLFIDGSDFDDAAVIQEVF
jgi:hypothetical protein